VARVVRSNRPQKTKPQHPLSDDIRGVFSDVTPKFVKRYVNPGPLISLLWKIGPPRFEMGFSPIRFKLDLSSKFPFSRFAPIADQQTNAAEAAQPGKSYHHPHGKRRTVRERSDDSRTEHATSVLDRASYR